MQLTHYNSDFEKRKFPIHLICDHILDSRNLGGIFRAADAFGISRLYICGDRSGIDKAVQRTSRSTEQFISHSFHSSTAEIVKQLKSQKIKIIALEITNRSKDLLDFKNPGAEPVALIIGSENTGISDVVLDMADSHYHINMFGQNSSMNVVQATSVALYEISRQYL